MAKSIRSKIKKRLRTVKRQRVDAMICTPREAEKNAALHRVIEGRSVTLARPKNAFKYPAQDGAVFPQHEIMKPIDFRAQNLPMAGYAFRGNRRKYEGEQKEFMENLKKSSHPKMEVLAGGGAILAKDGRRVSLHEAEILATAAAGRTDAAASAASAVAAAVREAANAAPPAAAEPESDAEMEGNGDVEHPKGEADHTRRPVVKDTRRVTRTAEARARTISSKKKNRGKVQQKDQLLADDEPATEAAASSKPVTTTVVVESSPAAEKGKVKKTNLKVKKARAGKGDAEGMDED